MTKFLLTFLSMGHLVFCATPGYAQTSPSTGAAVTTQDAQDKIKQQWGQISDRVVLSDIHGTALKLEDFLKGATAADGLIVQMPGADVRIQISSNIDDHQHLRMFFQMLDKNLQPLKTPRETGVTIDPKADPAAQQAILRDAAILLSSTPENSAKNFLHPAKTTATAQNNLKNGQRKPAQTQTHPHTGLPAVIGASLLLGAGLAMVASSSLNLGPGGVLGGLIGFTGAAFVVTGIGELLAIAVSGPENQ